jgi:hypothetical protein
MWLVCKGSNLSHSLEYRLMISSTYCKSLCLLESLTMHQGLPFDFHKNASSLAKIGFLNSPTLLIKLGFLTNLFIFINKHNHVLNMIVLFPSSTPIVNPFYFLHQLPLPRDNSRLYQPSEIQDIISPLCGSYRIYSTS